MKHIAYAETRFGTDEHLADLVLEYATLLARSGSADTVVVPGRIGTGEVEEISLVVGPASQITAWSDGEPFGADVTAAKEEIERRIRQMSASIPTSPDEPLQGFDEYED